MIQNDTRKCFVTIILDIAACVYIARTYVCFLYCVTLPLPFPVPTLQFIYLSGPVGGRPTPALRGIAEENGSRES